MNSWPSRIKVVEREFNSARLAVDRLQSEALRDPTILKPVVGLKYVDVRQASDHLSGTYIIRLFAEFETGLRDFWSATRQNKPPTRTRDLLDGIAAARKIPFDQLANAHRVRDYRNNLIHERDEQSVPVSVEQARRYLCRFFGYLPPDW